MSVRSDDDSMGFLRETTWFLYGLDKRVRNKTAQLHQEVGNGGDRRQD